MRGPLIILGILLPALVIGGKIRPSCVSYLRPEPTSSLTPTDRAAFSTVSLPAAGPSLKIFGAIGRFAPLAPVTELEDLEQFNLLAATMRSELGNQRAVKFLYEVETGRFYFVPTVAYPYHYLYAKEILRWAGSDYEFNQNYIGNGRSRQFILGTLVLSEQLPNTLLMELWSGDNLDSKSLVDVLGRLKSNLWEIELAFHPKSEPQAALTDSLRQQSIRVVKNDELYGNADQLLMSGSIAVGYLRIVPEFTTQPLVLEPTDIAVFGNAPNDIGLIAGLITEEFQTPFSHPHLRSLGRGTLNLCLPGARAKLAQYEGKPVRIHATEAGYAVEELPAEEADRVMAEFWKDKRPKPILAQAPPRLPVNGWVNLKDYYKTLPTPEQHRQLIATVGAKAANLALASYALRLDDDLHGVLVPEAFGEPFDSYDEFLTLNDLTRTIHTKLATTGLLDPEALWPLSHVSPVLKEIRRAHKDAQIPPSILERYRIAIFVDPTSPFHLSKKVVRIRLRSSTNVEDRLDFSGAGLYDSHGVDLFQKEDGIYHLDRPRSWEEIRADLEKMLRRDFRSLWNDRAFMERQWFSEDHMNARVGILIHRAFPSHRARASKNRMIVEIANGVAITANPYSSSREYPQYFINGQHYDLSVTNPPTAQELSEYGIPTTIPYVTEQILVTKVVTDPGKFYGEREHLGWTFQRLRRSSVKQEPVLQDHGGDSTALSETEVRRLALALSILQSVFSRVYELPPDSAWDVEWKVQEDPTLAFDRRRQLVVKQVRPYTAQTAETP